MDMLKMFQYRIYPTKKQLHTLNDTLDECRWVYNHLLEKRKHAYEHEGKSLTCYRQQSTYPLLKQDRRTLERVHSQVLQNVAVRIDLAFKAFFRRCKAGEKPGFPRFRGTDRYDSFTPLDIKGKARSRRTKKKESTEAINHNEIFGKDE
jgi:putative transposase